MTLDQMRGKQRERASACINVPPLLLLLAGLFISLDVLSYVNIYGTIFGGGLLIFGFLKGANRALLLGGLFLLYCLMGFVIYLALSKGGWLLLLLAIPYFCCRFLTQFAHIEIDNDVKNSKYEQEQQHAQNILIKEEKGRIERNKLHQRHKRLGGYHQHMTPPIALSILGLDDGASLEDVETRYAQLKKTISPYVLERQGLQGKALQQARKRMDKIDEAYHLLRTHLA